MSDHVTGAFPLCASCDHFHRVLFAVKCDAFPDGIPEDIWLGGFDHRQPHDGDHGIQWALRDGADEAFATYIETIQPPKATRT